MPYNTFAGLPSKFRVAILPIPLTLPTATELALPALAAYVALATVPVTLAPAIEVNPEPLAIILVTVNVLEVLLNTKLALAAKLPTLLY